uniref:Uncharacterized protein n=1 Tax=Podoviridae sp. ctoqT5 TaxID=2826577 RepID=A0A8S5MPA6_9CAUD|nr:MAG TPA: hypothetical protein [Podoviridae sp. ctoqT5]
MVILNIYAIFFSVFPSFFDIFILPSVYLFKISSHTLLSNSGCVYDSRSEVRVLCIGGKRARVGAFTIHPDPHRVGWHPTICSVRGCAPVCVGECKPCLYCGTMLEFQRLQGFFVVRSTIPKNTILGIVTVCQYKVCRRVPVVFARRECIRGCLSSCHLPVFPSFLRVKKDSL